MRKKITILIIIAVLILPGVLGPIKIFAQEVLPDATQSSTTSVDVSNTADAGNTTSSTADTGNNTISQEPSAQDSSSATLDPAPIPTETLSPIPSDTPTPTPALSPEQTLQNTTETLTPTPTQYPGNIIASNSADLTNNTLSVSVSGDNLVAATGSAEQSTDSQVSQSSVQNNNSNQEITNNITTGDATSVVSLQNSTNTTSLNSNVLFQTINIFLTKTGDINLSDPLKIASDAIAANEDEPVINVALTSVDNVTYLSNDVISFANTGINSINTPNETAVINTGNAYSVVSLSNQVNFTLVNSTIHIITINIFGKFNGNVILPENQSTPCNGCGISLNSQNSASLTNNVLSSAVSGENSIASSGTASINTGLAESSVNTINIINSTYIGAVLQNLFVANFGTWDGGFLGWGVIPADANNSNLSLSLATSGGGSNPCVSCFSNLSVTNDALVTNNISSAANTGGNSISAGDSIIKTGNAKSSVSLLNFVNSTFINSFGFFGWVNIFGDWTGNIGGASLFEKKDLENNTQPLNTETEDTSPEVQRGSSARENGGLLSVSQSNNTGEYVLPGDTVTFFVNTKNTGLGKVYGAKLHLSLIKDGKDAGGAEFELGDIGIGKEIKLSTGLVLSKSAPKGEYMARATVKGFVGEQNAVVSATSDSFFKVNGYNMILASGEIENTLKEKQKNTPAAVLGNTFPPKSSGQNSDLYLIIALLVTSQTYILIRAIRHRKDLVEIFTKAQPISAKLRAFRMFLL